MQTIVIHGRLAADPREPREAGSSEVADFRVLVNNPHKRDEEPIAYQCEIWGKRASVVQYLGKGDAVTVSGEVQKIETFERKNGDTGVVIVIRVNEVVLPPKANRDDDGDDRRNGSRSKGRDRDDRDDDRGSRSRGGSRSRRDSRNDSGDDY